MKTILVQAYTFDELSDEAKEKAREWAREVLSKGKKSLRECVKERLHEVLQERGVEFKEGEEEGSPERDYSAGGQGDGWAIFVGDMKWRGYVVKIEGGPDAFTIFDKAGNEIYDNGIRWDFKDFYIDVANELARYEYNVFKETASNEGVDDFIRENEYFFTEDGRRNVYLY